MQLTSQDIRQKYIDFFLSKSHAFIPSAPVVPENDATVLFNTAGMQPLVPYLLGEPHPSGTRLVDYQKCIRTNDIEDVGDNTHLTFFEMLGNWSLGDYFKEESLAWSYEFLTSSDWLGIDPRKLAVTVFAGDADAPRDEESARIWKNLWIENISYLAKEDNWWWPAGQTGPCGPDSEIFYRVGEETLPPAGSTVWNDPKNWMEIWNNVFMEFVKDENGQFLKASQQNVDTGMGLERITCTLSGAPSVYETDIFGDIIETIGQTLQISYDETTKKSVRIIADHIRTSVILVSDGISPSNVDQGYILRRLLRRAIRQGNVLGATGAFLEPIARKIIEKFAPIYTNMSQKSEDIVAIITKEETNFLDTLEKGLKQFDKLLFGFTKAFEHTGKKIDTIPGDKAFGLYETFGFPIEMTVELAREKGLKVDVAGFQEAYERHQALSRVGAEKKFAGWLADHSEATTALHTAAHLMLAGMRKVLGSHIHQAGSNITAERLRFDFTHPEKLTPEEIAGIEAYVNEAISNDAQMILENMDKNDAKEQWVEGSFWEKYPDIVKVYTFTDKNGVTYSRELCGGPHVERTGDMGVFKITKEESSSKGVRRVKAILQK